MSTRSFPPRPDDADDRLDLDLDLSFVPEQDADEAEVDDDERLEIAVTERGTQWSDDEDPDAIPADVELLATPATALPGGNRVAQFLGPLDRRTGLGGDAALLSDLDSEGLAVVRTVWPGMSSRARAVIAGRLVAAAAERYDLQFVRIFMDLLSDQDAVVRQFAVTGLSEEESSEIVERLVRLTEADSSADVRAASASALSEYATAAAADEDIGMDADELRDVLETIVVDEDEPSLVRRAALESWAVFGSRGAEGFSTTVAEAIAEMYNSGETDSQASALIAMGRTLDLRWLSFVERDLASDDAELRLAAVRSAGQLGETTLVEPVTVLTTDDDDEVRLAAVVALGQIGGPGAVRVLRNLAADPERTDQDAVNEAIEEANLAAEAI